MTRLEEIMDSLSPEAQREVEDFAEFLAKRRPQNGESNLSSTDLKAKHLSLSWAGGLRHLKDQYKSGLELQKKSLEWWGD
jgi:hypothetical protein